MSTEICEVIVTADNAEWLTNFTRRLVEDRIAACGQQITTIRSVYRWQGEIEEATEARVALHTRATLVDRVIERANAEHPYETPCVIGLSVTAGNPAYVQWVLDETDASGST